MYCTMVHKHLEDIIHIFNQLQKWSIIQQGNNISLRDISAFCVGLRMKYLHTSEQQVWWFLITTPALSMSDCQSCWELVWFTGDTSCAYFDVLELWLKHTIDCPTSGISQMKAHPAEHGLDRCIKLTVLLQQIILPTNSLAAMAVNKWSVQLAAWCNCS